MDKIIFKRAAGTIGWVVTMTCPHASFLVSQLNQLTMLDAAALKLVNRSVDCTLNFGAVGMRMNHKNLCVRNPLRRGILGWITCQ